MKEVVELKRGIAEALAPHHAMDALASLAIMTSLGSDETAYPEIVDVVEYIAGVLLERPSPEPSGGGPHGQPDLRGGLSRALFLAEDIRDKLFDAAKETRDSDPAALALVALDTELDDVLHRWPGELPQVARLLGALFKPDDDVATTLRGTLGFDGAQALLLERAVGEVFVGNFQTFKDGLNQQAGSSDNVRAATTASARDRAVTQKLDELVWRPGYFDQLAITVDQLVQVSGLDAGTVRAFVEVFSVGFGEVRGQRLMLTGRNVVRQRPLLRDAEDRMLLINGANLVWSVRPTLERALKGTPAWNIYQTHRAAYVESWTADLFEHMLGAECARNVSFRLADDPKPLWEADVLVRVDNMCLVVEVKTGALSDKARIGRSGEVKRDLDGLLGKSSRQAARLARAIRDGESVSFTDRASASSVAFDTSGITRVEPVVVTMEDLTPIAANVASLRGADLIAQDVEMPWLISIYDLEIVAATAEFAAQVTAYASRRRQLDARVWFNDEADVWATFLTASLNMAALPEPVVLLASGRSHLGGRCDPTEPAPQLMRLTSSQRRHLRRLHREREPGWLAEAEQVISDIQKGRPPPGRTRRA